MSRLVGGTFAEAHVYNVPGPPEGDAVHSLCLRAGVVLSAHYFHFSTVCQQRCQLSGISFGAIRKSSWHILQSLNARLPLGFGTVLSGATKWNGTSAGTRGKITSLHLGETHMEADRCF